ncbi:MAG: hypothetical protein A2Y07_11395 [Planctomycetes bacterium GWF2_50_10]|nr:MAG: hypothetical protein A2Y07_11395 [Planctomycetes bacterium GWF2_50_10]
MSKYNLERLGWFNFEKLATTLLRQVVNQPYLLFQEVLIKVEMPYLMARQIFLLKKIPLWANGFFK